MRTSSAWRHTVLVAVAVLGVLGTLLVTVSSPAQAAAALPRTGVVTQVAYGPSTQQWVQLTRPAAGGRRPAVIFVHGGGWVAGSVSMWRSESAYWSSRGWVSVNASYRLGSATDGTYQDGENTLADMSAVLRLTRGLPYVDRSRIVVVGDSAGGHLATYMAARHYGTVAGVILWSPVAAPSIAEETAVRWDDDADCPSDSTCARQRSLAARAHRLFGYSATTTNPLTYLDHYGSIPTWVAGSADEWVPFEDNGAVLCAASAGKCSSHLVDGDLHATKLRDANRSLLTSARRWAAKTVGMAPF